MALEFLYRQPVVIRFGWGRIAELAAVLKEQGADRCLVVCDRFFRGRAERLRQEIPVIAAVFSDVEENPQLSGVEGAVALIRENRVNAVVGMGGGSTMDTAKFAAAIAWRAAKPSTISGAQGPSRRSGCP